MQFIANHFGIKRKLKLDDSIKLNEEHLKGIIKEPKEKQVLFPFGSITFVNFQEHEKTDMLNYLKKIERRINVFDGEFFDEYKLGVLKTADEQFDFEYMQVKDFFDFLPEMIATVLAKSVALERIEHAIDILLDETNDVVANLHAGKLVTNDNQLAAMSANVLEFKLDTISFVAILDKPEITWENEKASEVFEKLSEWFEIEERFVRSQNKIDTLKEITDVFTALAYAKRGNRLEWAIIILISAELLLGLYDKLILPFFH